MISKIAVTGATGFIGRHVVGFLSELDCYKVVAVGRSKDRLLQLGVDHVALDLNVETSDCYELLGRPDILIHLAWEDLPNYDGLFHIERNLMASYSFLKALVKGGLQNLTVAGTCYEYGLQSGCLTETTPSCPVTCYALAKDTLHRFLEALRGQNPFSLRWTRLFYLYGDGQNPRALIPQLERAISSGAGSFDMSRGEQLRDYLPVERAAALISMVALQNSLDGTFNICSGVPLSVRRLVEERLASKGATMRLNMEALPYPDYEPMACWGDTSRLREAICRFNEERSLLQPDGL
jgi:nucleoside-diphosphate-sugar epimerase